MSSRRYSVDLTPSSSESCTNRCKTNGSASQLDSIHSSAQTSVWKQRQQSIPTSEEKSSTLDSAARPQHDKVSKQHQTELQSISSLPTSSQHTIDFSLPNQHPTMTRSEAQKFLISAFATKVSTNQSSHTLDNEESPCTQVSNPLHSTNVDKSGHSQPPLNQILPPIAPTIDLSNVTPSSVNKSAMLDPLHASTADNPSENQKSRKQSQTKPSIKSHQLSDFTKDSSSFVSLDAMQGRLSTLSLNEDNHLISDVIKAPVLLAGDASLQSVLHQDDVTMIEDLPIAGENGSSSLVTARPSDLCEVTPVEYITVQTSQHKRRRVVSSIENVPSRHQGQHPVDSSNCLHSSSLTHSHRKRHVISPQTEHVVQNAETMCEKINSPNQKQQTQQVIPSSLGMNNAGCTPNVVSLVTGEISPKTTLTTSLVPPPLATAAAAAAAAVAVTAYIPPAVLLQTAPQTALPTDDVVPQNISTTVGLPVLATLFDPPRDLTAPLQTSFATSNSSSCAQQYSSSNLSKDDDQNMSTPKRQYSSTLTPRISSSSSSSSSASASSSLLLSSSSKRSVQSKCDLPPSHNSKSSVCTSSSRRRHLSHQFTTTEEQHRIGVTHRRHLQQHAIEITPSNGASNDLIMLFNTEESPHQGSDPTATSLQHFLGIDSERRPLGDLSCTNDTSPHPSLISNMTTVPVNVLTLPISASLPFQTEMFNFLSPDTNKFQQQQQQQQQQYNPHHGAFGQNSSLKHPMKQQQQPPPPQQPQQQPQHQFNSTGPSLSLQCPSGSSLQQQLQGSSFELPVKHVGSLRPEISSTRHSQTNHNHHHNNDIPSTTHDISSELHSNQPNHNKHLHPKQEITNSKQSSQPNHENNVNQPPPPLGQTNTNGPHKSSHPPESLLTTLALPSTRQTNPQPPLPSSPNQCHHQSDRMTDDHNTHDHATIQLFFAQASPSTFQQSQLSVYHDQTRSNQVTRGGGEITTAQLLPSDSLASFSNPPHRSLPDATQRVHQSSYTNTIPKESMTSKPAAATTTTTTATTTTTTTTAAVPTSSSSSSTLLTTLFNPHVAPLVVSTANPTQNSLTLPPPDILNELPSPFRLAQYITPFDSHRAPLNPPPNISSSSSSSSLRMTARVTSQSIPHITNTIVNSAGINATAFVADSTAPGQTMCTNPAQATLIDSFDAPIQPSNGEISHIRPVHELHNVTNMHTDAPSAVGASIPALAKRPFVAAHQHQTPHLSGVSPGISPRRFNSSPSTTNQLHHSQQQRQSQQQQQQQHRFNPAETSFTSTTERSQQHATGHTMNTTTSTTQLSIPQHHPSTTGTSSSSSILLSPFHLVDHQHQHHNGAHHHQHLSELPFGTDSPAMHNISLIEPVSTATPPSNSNDILPSTNQPAILHSTISPSTFNSPSRQEYLSSLPTTAIAPIAATKMMNPNPPLTTTVEASGSVNVVSAASPTCGDPSSFGGYSHHHHHHHHQHHRHNQQPTIHSLSALSSHHDFGDFSPKQNQDIFSLPYHQPSDKISPTSIQPGLRTDNDHLHNNGSFHQTDANFLIFLPSSNSDHLHTTDTLNQHDRNNDDISEHSDEHDHDHETCQDPSHSPSELDDVTNHDMASQCGQTNTFHQSFLPDEGDFTCPHCSKQFFSNSALQRHVRVHSRHAKQHTCQECRKTFNRASELTRHSKLHSPNRPFQCQYCNKRFTTRANCRVHERCHTGQRPYSCTMCNMAFAQISARNNHIRTHTNEKPFQCQCGKSFAQAATLRAHLQRRITDHCRRL